MESGTIDLTYNNVKDIQMKNEPDDNNFDRVPVVYTTRLEEMRAFKVSYCIFRNLLEHVIRDSKPVFKGLPKQFSVSMQDRKILLRKVYYRLASYNRYIKRKNGSKQQSSLKYFHAIDVEGNLREYKLYNGNVTFIHNPEKNTFEESSQIEKISESEEDNMPLTTLKNQNITDTVLPIKDSALLKMLQKKSVPPPLNSKTFSNTPNFLTLTNSKIKLCRNSLFVIENVKSKESDTYYLDNSGVITSYYKNIDIKSRVDLYFRNNCQRVITQECCCWFKREDLIRKMEDAGYIYKVAGQLMRKQHKCMAGKCACCCNNTGSFHTNANNAVDKEIKDLDNNILESIFQTKKNMLNKTHQLVTTEKATNNLITKALLYKMDKFKNTVTTQLSNDNRFPQIKLIRIENSITNETESYYLDFSGKILTYHCRKMKAFDSILETNKYIYSTKVCCWPKREQIISSLIDMNIPYSVIRFIRRPHVCPVGNCSCCCNGNVKGKIELIFSHTHLPIHTKHTTNSTKNISPHNIILNVNRIVKTPYTNFNEHNASESSSDNDKTIANIAVCGKNNVCTSNNVLYNNKSKKSDNEHSITTLTTNKKCIDSNSNFFDNNNDNISESMPKNIRQCDDLNTEEMIKSILKSFEHMDVFFNKNDEVVAKLHTTANNLSTLELKVLSKLLARIEDEVIGISSGGRSITEPQVTSTLTSKSFVSDSGTYIPTRDIFSINSIPNLPVVDKLTNILDVKTHHYMKSFQSFVYTQDQNKRKTDNVISIKDTVLKVPDSIATCVKHNNICNTIQVNKQNKDKNINEVTKDKNILLLNADAKIDTLSKQCETAIKRKTFDDNSLIPEKVRITTELSYCKPDNDESLLRCPSSLVQTETRVEEDSNFLINAAINNDNISTKATVKSESILGL